MTYTDPIPFALSLSKGNGAPSARSWFDRPVLSEVEGLTTNGNVGVSYFYELQ